MIVYIGRRILISLITLFGITLITFLVIQMAPGDPAQMQTLSIADAAVSKRVYEQPREYYELDKPLLVQYGLWIRRVLTGDFGNSFHDQQKVSVKIREAFWPTISVALLSLFLTYIVAIPIGVYSAAAQGGLFDRTMSIFVYVLYSIPSYVTGMLLIFFVGVKLGVPFVGMRSDGYDDLTSLGKFIDVARHYVMITLSFSLANLAYYSRFARQNLLEVVRQDYIRTARAKGLSENVVIWKHAFVNSLIPLITLMSLTFPFILSGSVILETMFNWPGLGRLFFDSVMRRDYPTIMALNFITAVLVLVITLISDLAYGVVDPRVSYGR